MVKNDDSGLRAGFVRGDGAAKASEKKKESPNKETSEKVKKPKDEKKAAPAPKKEKKAPVPEAPKEAPKGPTITMQGVSGKKITGVVKVVKVKKAPKKAVEPEADTADKTAAAVGKSADTSDKDAAAVDKAVPAASASEAESKTVKSKAPADAAAEKPAKPKTQAEGQTDAKEKPQEKAADEGAAKTDETPAAKAQDTSVKTPRAQGRRTIDPSERAPGQGGDFVKRAPRGPQSGRRINSEDLAPGQGGSFIKRPQRPAAPRPRGGRDRGGAPAARSGNMSAPSTPEKIQEKQDSGKANFAARDAFDRSSKREPRREQRKDSNRIEPVTKDKHKTLKKQAQVISGKDVSDVLKDETLLDPFDRQSKRGRRQRGRRRQKPSSTPHVKAVLKHVKLPETLTVKEFSEAIKKSSGDVIKKLIGLGIMATVNQEIDFDTATLIAQEFDITTEKLVEVSEEDILFDDSEDQDENLTERPPVVVVMGHVDHGKTSILDRIRSASVAEGEAGGITQHIGAYMIEANERSITFLDTPGHEAFTTMRARGAQVTDIAILVVAADDGVMPQTVEAINHAKAANTQVIVAINKIDLPDTNIDRVKQELSNHDLIPEEWGGSTIMVPVSAMTGDGMDELLDMVLLTADIMELKTNPDKQAKGTVIEARLDRSRGPVATVLVQRGTLKTGNSLVTGSIIGRIRAMNDDRGQPVKEAGPSVPVEILGMPEVPVAGEIFYAVTDDRVARNLADKRRVQEREKQLKSSSRMNLDSLFSQMESGEVQELNIIVKADVQGSVEAVRQALEKLTNAEVRVNVVHGAVGTVNESDIRLAEVSNAIIIGFNVRPSANVSELAEQSGVDVRLYRVIYNAIEDIEAAMKGMLAPEFKEVVLGHAEVRQVFRVSGVGTIAGCYVTDGKIARSNQVRIVRDGVVIHEGQLASLKRFKDDAREVNTGYECGIGLERFNDIKENDVIEAFEMQETERS